jgi:DegV family protein with EDD domain
MLKLTTDATYTLGPELLEKYNISARMTFPIHIEGKDVPIDVTRKFDPEEIREAVRQKKPVTTSGVTPEEVLNIWKSVGDNPIFHFAIARTLSEASWITLEKIQKENSDIDVVLFDPMIMSSGAAAQLIEVAKSIQEGKDREEVYDIAMKNRKRTVLMGAMKDLFYLSRTGKIGFAKSLFGSMLKIIPLTMAREENTKLEQVGKGRSYQQINTQIINQIKRDAEYFNTDKFTMVITCSGEHNKEVNHLVELINKEKNLNCEIEIGTLTAQLLVHQGPAHWEIGYVAK